MQTRPPIIEKIAKAYGLDSWDKIEAICYTFNAEGALKLSRTWVWEPRADRVSYEGKDEAGKPVKLLYLRSQVSSQPALVKDKNNACGEHVRYGLSPSILVPW